MFPFNFLCEYFSILAVFVFVPPTLEWLKDKSGEISNIISNPPLGLEIPFVTFISLISNKKPPAISPFSKVSSW